MKKANWISILFCVLLVLSLVNLPLQAQNLDNVKLFQSYFYDTPITKVIYGEGGLEYGSYDGWSATRIGVQGGYPYNQKFEIGADIDYLSISPDEGDGESGLSDLAIFGRYLLKTDKKNSFSAGGMLTLPIGSKDIGQGALDFGAYGAMRHLLENGMIVTGTAALIFDETKWGDESDRDNYLRLGGGVIYPMDPKTAIVGELVMQTEGDYMMLSGGVDYKMGDGTLRGGIGLGLDDGAPDFTFIAKYAITLK